MLTPTLIAVLLTPLVALAAPTRVETPSLYNLTPSSRVLGARQSVVTPAPCVAIYPLPSAEETEARHDEFVNAFLAEKNITKAFEYAAASYRNHNPYVEDGAEAALYFLSPIWSTIEITNVRTRFENRQGWLAYNASGFGGVVDRFRWEAGCIVEHWDHCEVFPEA